MATTEERFNAAVNVIRNLPKNGSYQPSNDMMLRFYSYFKQATLGPCTQKKPAFWDVVNKAKWDAWKSLGQLPREEAMKRYVEELRKIIETMSYTDNVAQFMGSINELDNIDVSDLEAVAPEAIQKARSHPNSPFASRESSPVRAAQRNGSVSHKTQNGYLSASETNGDSDYTHQNGHSVVDHSDDEYIDTIEDDSMIHPAVFHTSRSYSRYGSAEGSVQSPQASTVSQSNDLQPIINQVLRSMEQLNADFRSLDSRILAIERSIKDIKSLRTRTKRGWPSWWPFEDISPNWFLFLVIWPLVANRLFNSRRK